MPRSECFAVGGERPSHWADRYHAVDEPQGRLPRQRAHGELLSYSQDRTGSSPHLCHSHRGPKGSVPVHRGLLQLPPPTLGSGLSQPSSRRAIGGLTPSTSSGEDQIDLRYAGGILLCYTAAFHGYYDCYCYLPLYIFCGRHLLAAKLRRSNIDASAGAVEEVTRIVDHIRARWPRLRICCAPTQGLPANS